MIATDSLVSCTVCERFRTGQPHEGSPEGYVYEDMHWYAYHAPVQSSSVGQLFLVAKRHYLDFTEMTDDEATTYGLVLCRLYTAIKAVTRAERVYTQITFEGIPHFHAWLIPRYADDKERGCALIAQERSCSHADATRVTMQLRQALHP